MPSKEEIENAKKCLKEIIQNTYAEGKAIKLNNALEYIEQLETDKQKLIEKLEEKQAEIDSLNEFYETYDINYGGQTVLIDRNRFKEVIGADKDFSILVVNKLPEVEEN